jgi:hypothetical protein
MSDATDQACCIRTPAQQRHNRRVLIAAIGYVILLLPVVYAIRHGMVAGAWRIPLALLPAIPLAFMFGSYARYLSEERDEYVRMLVVNQVLAATTVSMVCAVFWGFLEELGGGPHIPTYWIAVVWIAVQGASASIARRRGA